MSHSEDSSAPHDQILLTGATGYVGGLLRKQLEADRKRIRSLSRHPAELTDLAASTEAVQGDVLDPSSLADAMRGISAAYYLVHSMGSAEDFEKTDRQAARNFGDAAKRAGVRRIIYLGGLGDENDPKLSPHLRSRHEVGRVLRDSGVETIELRASAVLGSGSLSFEMIRALTNRLPIMICPKWLTTPTQPIAVSDLLEYLMQALHLPAGPSRIFEIGGSDVVSYGELISEYARQQGLRRWLISVPVLTPYLSGLWLGLVTPATAEIGRHLIEGLRNPTAINDPAALAAFTVKPMGVEPAIRNALAETN